MATRTDERSPSARADCPGSARLAEPAICEAWNGTDSSTALPDRWTCKIAVTGYATLSAIASRPSRGVRLPRGTLAKSDDDAVHNAVSVRA
jgi:hypothetical protein